MADSITFAVARERIDEGTALVVVTRFFRDDVATPPASAYYRIDEMRSGRRILDWTQLDVSSAPTAVSILITASQNLCRRHRNEIVTRQLTVVSGRGTSRQCVRTFRYEIATTLSREAEGFLDDAEVGGDIAPVLAAERSGTSVTLTWTAAVPLAGTVASYEIWKEDGPTLLATVDGNVLTHGLTQSEDTDVTYYVVAVTDVGGRLASNHVAATVGGPLPPVLDGSITGEDNTTASLSWSAGVTTGGPITGYKVYQDGSLIHTIANPATLTYDVTGLTTDTSYSFNVTATTAANESADSNTLVLEAGHPLTIIDIFRSSGTWPKRSGLLSIDFTVIGGGAGGAGGRGSGGALFGGAGGGGGGGIAMGSIDGSFLPSTIAAVVGSAGSGGNGGNGNLGSAGTVGSDSTFWAGANGNPGDGIVARGGGVSTSDSGNGPEAAGGNGGGATITLTGVTVTGSYTESGGKGGGSQGTAAATPTKAPGGGGGGLASGATGGGGASSPTPYTGDGGTGGGGVTGGSPGGDGHNGTVAGGGGGGGGGSSPANIGVDPPGIGGDGGDGADGVIVIVNHLS